MEEVVFCGFGEPLVRLDCLLEVAKWIKKNYGKIIIIRVDTNGQGFLFNNKRALVNLARLSVLLKIDMIPESQFQSAFLKG